MSLQDRTGDYTKLGSSNDHERIAHG